MKKIFILLALIAYFLIGAYSVTRTKGSALTTAKAQSAESAAVIDFKLVTNQPEAMMKFYADAFGTDWQAVENGYQGQVLNAHVQLVTVKNKKPRRATLNLRANDLATQTNNLLAAGGSVKANGKSYVANDPDGNLIVLTRE